MGASRGAKPLFDLIRERPPAPVTPRHDPAQAIVAEPKPAPRDEARARADRGVERFEAAASLSRAPAEGGAPPEVRIPLNALYLGAAGLIAAMILVWIGGVSWGRSSERTRLLPQIQATPPSVTDPLRTDANRGAGEASGLPALPKRDAASLKPPVEPRPAPAGEPRDAGTPGAILGATGELAMDPRQPGFNYLALATLPREEAFRAVRFLSENGMDAMAAPVDRGSATGNNPSRDPGSVRGVPYQVIVLRGFPGGDQFGQFASDRQRLEAEAARLGSVWQREHRGASNFSRPGWQKYQP